jgi:ABC-type nitrate/sulfonate/bicarbonate transport system permease component
VLAAIGYPIAAAMLVVVVWYAVIAVFRLPPFVMPTPVAAVGALWEDRIALQPLILTTMTETVLGFLAGAGFGFGCAVLMSQVRVVQRVLYPLLVTSQAVPIIAIAPPLVILFGFGLTPKLIIVGLIVFFPVLVSVTDGLARVDKDMLNLARIMSGSPLRTFLLIKLPATYSPLFSGLKIGATYAITGAIIGEWTASSGRGLGNYIRSADAALDTAAVYGATLLLTLLGVGSFLVVVAVERFATPWRYRATARRWPWTRPAPPTGEPDPSDRDRAATGLTLAHITDERA